MLRLLPVEPDIELLFSTRIQKYMEKYGEHNGGDYRQTIGMIPVDIYGNGRRPASEDGTGNDAFSGLERTQIHMVVRLNFGCVCLISHRQFQYRLF